MTHHALAGTARGSEAYMRQQSLPGGLAALGVPVLVIFGAEDARYPSSSSAAAYRAVPSAPVELLPGVGHTPMMEDPQATATLLLNFAQTSTRVAVDGGGGQQDRGGEGGPLGGGPAGGEGGDDGRGHLRGDDVPELGPPQAVAAPVAPGRMAAPIAPGARQARPPRSRASRRTARTDSRGRSMPSPSSGRYWATLPPTTTRAGAGTQVKQGREPGADVPGVAVEDLAAARVAGCGGGGHLVGGVAGGSVQGGAREAELLPSRRAAPQ